MAQAMDGVALLEWAALRVALVLAERYHVPRLHLGQAAEVAFQGSLRHPGLLFAAFGRIDSSTSSAGVVTCPAAHGVVSALAEQLVVCTLTDEGVIAWTPANDVLAR